MVLRERNGFILGVSVRYISYLAALYNVSVFAANFILYIDDRSWQNDSEWERWQWVDLTISGVSIIAAILLFTAIIIENCRLLQIFLVWGVACIVLSVFVLGFGFAELERGQIVARCVGIVISAFFLDVIFSYYLTLKKFREAHSRDPNEQPNKVVSTPATLHPPTMFNGSCVGETSRTLQQNNGRNVRLWYEDTKF